MPTPRYPRASWSRYLVLGMSRHESFCAENIDDFAAQFTRSATYLERAELAPTGAARARIARRVGWPD